MNKVQPDLKKGTYYVLLAFFFLAVCIQFPFLLLDSPPPFKSWLFACGAGAAFLLAQVFLVKGYEYADAAKVGVFQYTTIIYVGIIDWLIWNVVPYPSELIGVLLVIVAGILIIRSAPLKA